jgi:hypothetical protein
MSLCTYWQAGNCRFGEQCRNIHAEASASFDPMSGGSAVHQHYKDSKPTSYSYQKQAQTYPHYSAPMASTKKDQLCKDFQMGECRRTPCPFTHGWSRTGDIQLLTRGKLLSPITSAAVVSPTQVALSEAHGKISIFDLQEGSIIAEFETRGAVQKLHFHSITPHLSFLWFAGAGSS